MKKATKRARATAEAAPRPLSQIVEDIRRGVEEYATHPDVTPNNVDFLLIFVSVMECQTALTPERISDADDQEGYRELARAFAAFQRYANLLPRQLYNELDEWATELENASQWQNEPELIRAIYPLLLRQLKQKKYQGWRREYASAEAQAS